MGSITCDGLKVASRYDRDYNYQLSQLGPDWTTELDRYEDRKPSICAHTMAYKVDYYKYDGDDWFYSWESEGPLGYCGGTVWAVWKTSGFRMYLIREEVQLILVLSPNGNRWYLVVRQFQSGETSM